MTPAQKLTKLNKLMQAIEADCQQFSLLDPSIRWEIGKIALGLGTYLAFMAVVGICNNSSTRQECLIGSAEPFAALTTLGVMGCVSLLWKELHRKPPIAQLSLATQDLLSQLQTEGMLIKVKPGMQIGQLVNEIMAEAEKTQVSNAYRNNNLFLANKKWGQVRGPDFKKIYKTNLKK
jgi:hypothetical protein